MECCHAGERYKAFFLHHFPSMPCSKNEHFLGGSFIAAQYAPWISLKSHWILYQSYKINKHQLGEIFFQPIVGRPEGTCNFNSSVMGIKICHKFPAPQSALLVVWLTGRKEKEGSNCIQLRAKINVCVDP